MAREIAPVHAIFLTIATLTNCSVWKKFKLAQTAVSRALHCIVALVALVALVRPTFYASAWRFGADTFWTALHLTQQFSMVTLISASRLETD